MYQDLALCDNLDTVQNLFLGRERAKGGVLDEGSMGKAAEGTLRELSVTSLCSIRQKVGSLSGGRRQAVAVARSALWNSKLVIMDEPTAAPGVAQARVVLDLVRRLADRGVAVVMISHKTCTTSFPSLTESRCSTRCRWWRSVRRRSSICRASSS